VTVFPHSNPNTPTPGTQLGNASLIRPENPQVAPIQAETKWPQQPGSPALKTSDLAQMFGKRQDRFKMSPQPKILVQSSY
jgi:hypothetical protein